MFVLHIRDLLFCFIGIVVNFCSFIRLTGLIHLPFAGMLPLLIVILFAIVLFILLRLLLIFLIVHVAFFKPLTKLFATARIKK